MSEQNEVAIQRAVERALVNIYWPTVTRKEGWNDLIRGATQSINARTDLSPATYGPSPEPIDVKGKIKGEDIRLSYHRPIPSASVSSPREQSKPHPVPSVTPGLSRSEFLAVCGVLLQLATVALLFAILVRQ